MKKIGLFLLTAVLFFHTFAQNQKGYVYLKNGTILKGEFQYSNDLNKLRVESAGNIWVFEASEIDSISSGTSANVSEIRERFISHQPFYRAGLGLLIGNSNNSQPAPLSFAGTMNYPLTANVSAGAGIGVEYFKETYLPAFINLEYRFRNNTVSTPFLFLTGGYDIPLESPRGIYYDAYPMSSIWPGPNYYNEDLKAKGGGMINPGVGYMYLFSPGFGMSVAFGYRFHRLRYKGENNYELQIDYNRLSLTFGIIFN